MFRLIDRMIALAALALVVTLMRILPERWFSPQRGALAALWFDLGGMAIPAGAANDSPFGYVSQMDDFNRVALDSNTVHRWNVNTAGGGTAFAINALEGGGISGGLWRSLQSQLIGAAIEYPSIKP